MEKKVKQILDIAFANDFVTENNKIEFKKEWYNLKEDQGINEFLKDITSIVNSYGPEGFLIFGVDEKEKTLVHSNLLDSGIEDMSKVHDLLIRKLSHPFDIDYHSIEYKEKIVSLIHIPPSFEKPHFIKNYKNFKKGELKKELDQVVFVRKGSKVSHATKYDVDLMYWDRKNIRNDFTLTAVLTKAEATLHSTPFFDCYRVCLLIDNAGRRPISMRGLSININDITFKSYKVWIGENYFTNKDGFAYVFLANSITNLTVYFICKEFEEQDYKLRFNSIWNEEAILVIHQGNGKNYIVSEVMNQLNKD